MPLAVAPVPPPWRQLEPGQNPHFPRRLRVEQFRQEATFNLLAKDSEGLTLARYPERFSRRLPPPSPTAVRVIGSDPIYYTKEARREIQQDFQVPIATIVKQEKDQAPREAQHATRRRRTRSSLKQEQGSEEEKDQAPQRILSTSGSLKQERGSDEEKDKAG